MDDVYFPNVAKLQELFKLLPPGSAQEAERIALREMRDFQKENAGTPMSHETLRGIGNMAAFLTTLSLCKSKDHQDLCREAYGLRNRFFPAPIPTVTAGRSK